MILSTGRDILAGTSSKAGLAVFDDPETRCRTVLAPYASILWRIPHVAWARLATIPDRAVFSATTRANVVSSFMIDAARELLLPVGRVAEIPNHVSTVFMVEDEVVVRFKHLDNDGFSHNYPTDRAQRYNSCVATLPGISASAMRVDLGYKLNTLETAIDSVLVSRRSGQRIQWSYELTPEGASTLPIQIPLDATAAEIPVRVRRRVQPDELNILKFRQGTDAE